jgi:hypothetical protein
MPNERLQPDTKLRAGDMVALLEVSSPRGFVPLMRGVELNRFAVVSFVPLRFAPGGTRR